MPPPLSHHLRRGNGAAGIRAQILRGSTRHPKRLTSTNISEKTDLGDYAPFALWEMSETFRFTHEWVRGDRIGGGGFGEVYAAKSENGEPAAIKLVPKVPGAAREFLFADVGDARNVVPIIDRGETTDSWVLVMPRAEKSLRQHINEIGSPLMTAEAVTILKDIAVALVDLDGRIVHRDLKPENILLLNGSWCLADFGISRYAEASTAQDTQKHTKSSHMRRPSDGEESGRRSQLIFIRLAS